MIHFGPLRRLWAAERGSPRQAWRGSQTRPNAILQQPAGGTTLARVRVFGAAIGLCTGVWRLSGGFMGTVGTTRCVAFAVVAVPLALAVARRPDRPGSESRRWTQIVAALLGLTVFAVLATGSYLGVFRFGGG
jgi:hypothetical protein